MSIGTSTAKQETHDKLDSRIKSAETKLVALKARAEAAKANVETKTIANLTSQKLEMQKKLQELKNSTDEKWEHTKNDLEARITALEKSIHEIEAKVKAH